MGDDIFRASLREFLLYRAYGEDQGTIRGLQAEL